tara:strand:+ start:3559 stop:4137 length:579 start_codon:yes stop_codon:yes gene_type:complete
MIEKLVRNEAPSLLDTDKANELIAAINGLLNSRGEGGISVKQDQDGSLLIAPGKDGKPYIRYHPFEVISVSLSNIVINPGLVNGLIVSNVDVAGATGTNYLCLEIAGDSDGVTSVDLVLESSPPDGIEFVENGVNTTFKYPIAIVGETSLISQLVDHNLFFAITVAFEQPKATVAIGEYPNNIYYTWKQTAG